MKKKHEKHRKIIAMREQRQSSEQGNPSTKQGLQWIASRHRELEVTRKDSPLQVSEEA
jgi:hypothetical protein